MMRSSLALTIIMAGGLVAFQPLSVLADATSSPGKFTAATSISAVTLDPQAPAPAVSVQLSKGKSKRMLLVAGTVVVDSLNGHISLTTAANGVDLNFSDVESITCFTTNRCFVSGTWWLDLDAAEVAAPGVFKNQPITISMAVFAAHDTFGPCIFPAACPGGSYTATLTAQQVKK